MDSKHVRVKWVGARQLSAVIERAQSTASNACGSTGKTALGALLVALTLATGCADPGAMGTGPGGMGSGDQGTGGLGTGGPGTGGAGSSGVGSGGSGGGGDVGSSGSGSGGSGSGGSGSGGGGGPDASERPLQRADGFMDAAPPIGAPLPSAPNGTWTWVDLPGATCRDGSGGGLYVRYSSASPNFFIYLEGGGVCLNDFFCGINPKNVNETLNAESIFAGVTGKLAVEQKPGNDGIFKSDPSNPVRDWNAIYVPYCTGDIWGGNRPNATFPPGFEGLAGHTGGQHQFVGFDYTSIVLGRAVATFPDAKKVLLSGSSAGGIGALLNGHRLADLMTNAGMQARGYVVSDSAVPFADQYLAACTQKTWRDLWGLDASLPADCPDCFPNDGGNMAPALAAYFKRKFPDNTQVLGGLISASDDEVIKLFYESSLPACTPKSLQGGNYLKALQDFRDNVAGRERFGTYYMTSTLHMHLWRPRFYEDNGTGTTIADWLTRILNNEAAHVGN